MSRRSWIGIAVLLAMLIAYASAPGFWHRSFAGLIYDRDNAPVWFYEPRVRVAGAPSSGPPHVQPELQAIDPAALAEAARVAEANSSQALIVSRRSHIVLEKYWNGSGPRVLENSGTFSAPLSAVMLGIALSESRIGSLDEPASNYLKDGSGQTPLRDLDPQNRIQVIERATGEPYAQYVSERLWKRIGASDAYLWLDRKAGTPHRDCCMLAFPADWMRLAELLTHDGVYLGEEILRPGWIQRIFTPVKDNTNDYGVHDMLVLDGGRQRLWVSPSLQLAVLQVSGNRLQGGPYDNVLPRGIINGLRDFKPASATPSRAVKPSDYAPGH